MRKTNRPISLMLVVAAAILAATATAGEPAALGGTSWRLAGLAGNKVSAGVPVTLRFEEGRVEGTDGCNRYGAAYVATATTLKVEPKAASTRMACPAEVEAQASAFSAALSRATGYRLEGGRLLLTADGAVVAAFDPETGSVAGTSWIVTGFNTGSRPS